MTIAVGASSWMAPEQTDPSKDGGPAEVWALGLLAFRMLTGKPYWLSAGDAGATDEALRREVLSGALAPASARAKELGCGERLPTGFDVFFARCVVREAERRFGDVGDAQRVLAAVLDGNPMDPEAVAALPSARARGPVETTGLAHGTKPVELAKPAGQPPKARRGDRRHHLRPPGAPDAAAENADAEGGATFPSGAPPVGLAQRGSAPPGQKRRSAAWMGFVAATVLGLGLVSAAGFAGYTFFGRERITDTPCGQGALSLIGTLKSPVTVTLYTTKGLPKLDKLAGDVSVMMRDIEKASKGKLVYKLVVVTNPEQRSEAIEAGVTESAFGDSGTDHATATILRGFCGMALTYGSEKEAIPVLAPEAAQGIPFWIVQKVRELRGRADDAFQRFGVVSGKDEIKLTEPNLMPAQPGRGAGPNMKGIFTQAMPYYKLDEVDLRGGEAEIDGDLAGLVVTQPGLDFTDKELRRIDQYLMRGNKSVVVIASAVNVKAGDHTMQGELSLHGLDRLLAGYGIEMRKDALLDWGRSVSFPTFTPSGAGTLLRAPGLLTVEHDNAAAEKDQALDSTFIPFFRLDELIFPFASSLATHPEKQPDARFRIVARSSPGATAETASPVALRPTTDPTPRGAQAQHVIAVAVDGKLKSAFAGQPGDGVSAPAAAPESSRLFVLSSSQFLANPLARAGNPPPTPTDAMAAVPPGDEDLGILAQAYAQRYLTASIVAFKNTLDWAGADDATVSCSALLISEKRD